jgi:hypothetical protein
MNIPAVCRIPGTLIILWILLVGLPSIRGVEPESNSPALPQRAPASEGHLPFEVGETLVYNVSWKIFDVGLATMRLAEKLRFQNEEVYKVTATARSTGVLSTLFKVVDIFESYFQVKELCSRRITKTIREGGRQRDTLLIFDPKVRRAKMEEKDVDHPDLPVKRTESPIPLCVQDVISALYIIRTKSLKVGEQFSFPINDGGTTYNVTVEVQAEEEIKTPAGTFQALRLEPKVFDGLFKKKGRMFVWLTNDTAKMPIQLKAKINIGTITALLTRVDRTPVLRSTSLIPRD